MTTRSTSTKEKKNRHWSPVPLAIIMVAVVALAAVQGILVNRDSETRRRADEAKERVVRVERRTNCLSDRECRMLLEKLRQRAASDREINQFLRQVARREVGTAIEQEGVPPVPHSSTPTPTHHGSTPEPEHQTPHHHPCQCHPTPSPPEHHESPSPAPEQPQPESPSPAPTEHGNQNSEEHKASPGLGVEIPPIAPLPPIPCVKVAGTLHANCG